MVELKLPKLLARVRFSLPAPNKNAIEIQTLTGLNTDGVFVFTVLVRESDRFYSSSLKQKMYLIIAFCNRILDKCRSHSRQYRKVGSGQCSY